MTYAIHKLEGLPLIEENRKMTYDNIRYGMLVEVLHYNDGSYHAGCKVHFFNRKGVLIGNYYEFVPYERLRMRDRSRQHPRYFMGKKLEGFKTWLFIGLCNLITGLIKFTQKIMD